MKHTFISSIFIYTIVFSLLFSCGRKDKETDKEDTSTTEQGVFGSDEAQYSEAMDQAASDAEDLFAGSSFAGAKTTAVTICGATVDSTNFTTDKKITLTFDNTTPCINNTRKRNGQIAIQLTTGTKWNDVGAVLSITFTNYKVTRISDSKSITINGSKTITNVNGGLLRNLSAGSIAHRIQATDMNITFDDGTSRTWSTDRTRTLTKSGSDYLATIEGNKSVGGYSDVAVWGTNRYGNTFYTTIDTPVVLSSCTSQGRWKAISGVKTHRGLVKDITITFGVNQDGTSNGTCAAYGYKVNWEGVGGAQKQAVISY